MSTLRIGVDCDGVLADFVGGLRQLALFHYNIDIGDTPQEWDWWQAKLSKVQFHQLWHQITKHPEWWMGLKPCLDAPQAFQAIHEWQIDHGADVYVITSRPGDRVQWFSQKWINKWAHTPIPVLIAPDARAKGVLAAGLGLTHFVDDKPENVEAVRIQMPNARCCLLTRSWNDQHPGLTRITKVPELVCLKSSVVP
jgi:hypothetical protein